MTDQWVPGPPPAPPQWSNPLPPANSWDPTAPCASGDDPSIVSGVVITGRPATISAMPWQITLNDGGAPPNFTIDHFDDAGVLIESPIVIEGSSGDVMLTHDPTEDLGAATKRYVDTTGLREAPIDNTTYGRDNGTWVPLPATYLPEAPNTSQRYGRFNSIWQLDAIQTDAPSDGAAYARQNGGWTAAVTGGPYMPISGGAFTGVVTFPSNNSVAINGALNTPHAILGQVAGLMRWQLQMPDQTAEGVGNSGANFSLSAFSTTGGFLGTWLTINRADGATTFAGTGVTIAGGLAVNGLLAITNIGNLSIPGGNPGDAVTTNGSGVLSWAPRLTDAPSDGQFYTRQNAAWAVAPGGMTDAPNDGTAYARKNAAWAHLTHTDITDWTASLAPYALTTSVPVASATLPLMDGTAAAGSSAAFARGDHVHPTDTSRAAASALAGYLPLTGGTLTGPLTVAPSSGSGTAAGLIVQGPPGGYASLSLVKPASGLSNQIYGMTGVFGAANTLRWRMELGDTAPESGSNAGSNFAISNLSDAGGVLGTPLSISRNNGWMYLNGSGATPWAAEAAAPGHTAIRMNKASGAVVNALSGSVNGVFRWSMQIGDGGAESGSNAGSNFTINRYSDAGALIDAPFTIQRNTGYINSGSSNGDGCINLFGNTQPRLMFYNVAGTLRGQLCYQTSTAMLGIFSPGAQVTLNASNQCQSTTYYNASATAYMAGGTLWTNSSDARIKTVLGDYTFGLDHVLKLKPVRYKYKANDTIDERLDQPPITGDPDADAKYVMKTFTSAPYPASQHYLVKDQEFVGFVAQDVEDVFPGLVTKRKGFIDGKPVDDMRDLNLNDLIFALVNSVKTLSARVETLEAQLKGAT